MKTATVGEELFLVHLCRAEGRQAEGEHSSSSDTPPPLELEEGRKRRATSIGDELWQIHLKRSQREGEEDHDVAPSLVPDHENINKDTNSSWVGRYNLRSRTPQK